MNNRIIDFYKKTGIYTDYTPYKQLYAELPDDLFEIRELVNNSHIHKMSLYRAFRNENSNKLNKQYKSTNYRCLDDVLLTANSMTGEYLRLNDGQLFTNTTNPNKRLVITCRYVSVWYASILKSKGIPCRCRSGFAPYLNNEKILDHWIVQYYDQNFKKWVNVDAQANLNNINDREMNLKADRFVWAADAWLKMRNGTLKDKEKYVNGSKHFGDIVFAWSLMMDFHALFNDEITYTTTPVFLYDAKLDLSNLKKSTLKEMDKIAKLMQDVDGNWDILYDIWQNNLKFSSVASPLNAPWLHLELSKKDFD